MSLPDKTDKILNYKGLLDDKVTKSSAIDDKSTTKKDVLLAYAGKDYDLLGLLPKTKDLFLHIFSSVSNADPLGAFDYYMRISEKKDINGNNVWDDLGIKVTFKDSRVNPIEDLRQSLDVPGAIVVYWGHGPGNIENKKNYGLSFYVGPGFSSSSLNKTNFLSAKDLVNLLDKSYASVVLIAGCNTLACLKNYKPKRNNFAVVATDSNSDDNYQTYSNEHFYAIKSFLYTLIYCEDVFEPILDDLDEILTDSEKSLLKGMNTVNNAISTANKVFARVGSQKNKFALAGGDGTIRIV